MVALCDRKPTKIDTPKKREIREKMFAQKYEAKSKAYLQRHPQSRDDRISLMDRDVRRQDAPGLSR